MSPHDDALDEPAFVDNPGHTLLGRWQNSVLDLQDLAPGSVRSAPDDRSVELHVCHSLTRELEALHDRLLGLFRDDASLQPSDILVVTPDLDAAAPQVEAVFGAAAPELHIPYNLTGLGATRTNPAAAGMADLLALAGSRFVAAEVACWLAQPMVAGVRGQSPVPQPCPAARRVRAGPLHRDGVQRHAANPTVRPPKGATVRLTNGPASLPKRKGNDKTGKHEETNVNE